MKMSIILVTVLILAVVFSMHGEGDLKLSDKMDESADDVFHKRSLSIIR